MRRPLTVSAQLSVAFGLLLAVMLTIAAVAWLGLGRTNANMTSLYNDRVLPLAQLADVQRAALRDRILLLDMIRNPAPDNVAKRTPYINANRELARKSWKGEAESLKVHAQWLAKAVGTFRTPRVD